jgi:hypothetical protein
MLINVFFLQICHFSTKNLVNLKKIEFKQNVNSTNLENFMAKNHKFLNIPK